MAMNAANTATTTSTTSTTPKDAFLRSAMRLDAAFSTLLGVAGVAMAPRIAEMSGTTPALEYSLGTFLIGYGVVVYGLSLMRRVRVPGVCVTVGNVAFTIGSVALVLADLWPLTTTGIVLTLGGGVYTLVMADLQYLGLRRMRTP